MVGLASDAHRMRLDDIQVIVRYKPPAVKSEPNLLEVNLNTARIEKVLGNLVINALLYTSQGGKFQLSLTVRHIPGEKQQKIVVNGNKKCKEILSKAGRRLSDTNKEFRV
jgi:C4-dicarboxylate-specific signal transduction histidine kinase